MSGLRLALLCSVVVIGVNSSDTCYQPDNGIANACSPSFENAAFGKNVEVTNTCGMGKNPEQYCEIPASFSGDAVCYTCHENGGSSEKHNATFLTDVHLTFEPTWWQSESMFEKGKKDPQITVNLTLDLGKKFEVTYIRLTFKSPRADSLAIYKQSCTTCEWEPYQYFSSFCSNNYGVESKSWLSAEDEVACSSEHSGISPLSNGQVIFSTLRGRPRSWDFDNNVKLQEWVTASAIRISLNRMNTFGDEQLGLPDVLKSYYYAISDVHIGATCKCNGHASECKVNDSGRLVCMCKHGTAGDDCEKCADAYNDAPWKRGTYESANECKRCDCNGFSDTCVFDEEVYKSTGHGGRCVECQHKTTGIHCEKCLPNYYKNSNTSGCIACGCHPIGSTGNQCNEYGRCSCKEGVGGDKCDRCLPGYYDMEWTGCSPCPTCPDGRSCDPVFGDCVEIGSSKEDDENREFRIITFK